MRLRRSIQICNLNTILTFHPALATHSISSHPEVIIKHMLQGDIVFHTISHHAVLSSTTIIVVVLVQAIFACYQTEAKRNREILLKNNKHAA